ncbi:MAG TPA: hypothetical protein VHD60_00875 [Candidatus Saccharimonadales bacterium]|nr:hypothetical protein [Candidatus Saccharimonadales bacterium]
MQTWQQKYQTRTRPLVKVAEHDYGDVKTGTKVLISTPAEVEAELRNIPEGTEITLRELRARLARKHFAQTASPIVTSTCLHIVAENALDQMDLGLPIYKAAPFWRVIQPWTPLARKLSCGLAGLVVLRMREGLPVQ